jgi:hypothetical protein
MFGQCRSCVEWHRQNQILSARLADIEAARQKAQEAWTAERLALIERILAVEKPANLAALYKTERPAKPKQQTHMNYPAHSLELPIPRKEVKDLSERGIKITV